MTCSDGTSPDFLAPTNAETWSESSLQQLKVWLVNCLDNHFECRTSPRKQAIPKRRLPERLLETAPSDYDLQQVRSLKDLSIERLPYLRLRNSSELLPDTEYVTLSHCWGRHPSVAWGRHPAITLTNETLEDFYSHVPLLGITSREGATFKHAVQVARSLGFCYLWIDALCINQDDTQGKIKEISNMGSIYASSALNLSATASSSGSDGLFFSRHPVSVAPCKWRAYFGEKGNVTQGELTAYSNRWSEEVIQAPIYTRAWVFQERTLAPRVVHFSRDQIFWECASLQAAEIYPHGMPYQNEKGSYDTQSREAEILRTRREIDATHDMKRWEVCQEIWAALIPLYSRANLTLDADKLPAISGVARRLSIMSGLEPTNDYAAGLWHPGFARQLLWRADLAPNKPRPTSYRAPSWSWASIDTRSFPYAPRGNAPNSIDPSTPLSKAKSKQAVGVVQIKVDLKTEDQFGQVSGGFAKILGPLCRVKCERNHDGSESILSINGDTYPLNMIRRFWDCTPGLPGMKQTDLTSDFSPNCIYLMPFYPYPEPEDVGYGMVGLMLASTGRKRGQYSRLGLFDILDAEDCKHVVRA